MVVLELLRWKAPAALILCIVLLAANPKIPRDQQVDFVECFAGAGEVSFALWNAGLRGSSHDIRYSNLMDFCSPHGFAFLEAFGSIWVLMTFCAAYYARYIRYIYVCVCATSWVSEKRVWACLAKAGPQRTVECKARSTMCLCHLLQFVHPDVAWLFICWLSLLITTTVCLWSHVVLFENVACIFMH